MTRCLIRNRNKMVKALERIITKLVTFCYFRVPQSIRIKIISMSVTKKDVEYVANLARLSLTEGEVTQIQGDMNKIIEYMDQLNEVNTEDVQPLEHVTELTSPFRKDEALKPLDHEEALKNAPDADTDYFRVPKVIE